MKHLHFLVGGINSSSLEETTEAKWTSPGHETSERRRNGGGQRRGPKPEEETLPSISFATRQKKHTTSQRDLLEENSEALRGRLSGRPEETTAWLRPFTIRRQPLAQPSMRAVGSMEK